MTKQIDNYNIIKQQLIADAELAMNRMREEGLQFTVFSVILIINAGVAKFFDITGRQPDVNEINDIYRHFMYPSVIRS